jgi:hypothetical protein
MRRCVLRWAGQPVTLDTFDVNAAARPGVDVLAPHPAHLALVLWARLGPDPMDVTTRMEVVHWLRVLRTVLNVDEMLEATVRTAMSTANPSVHPVQRLAILHVATAVGIAVRPLDVATVCDVSRLVLT